MPIITLYGAKGGTGRTTTAAALARGMIKLGKWVMLIETDDADDPLARWFSAFDRSTLGVGDMYYQSCTSPDEIDKTLRAAPSDDRHVMIIDTSPRISAGRTRAFECADLVLMPFSGFLDADIGIANASSQLPAATYLRALPVQAPDGVSKQVAKWIPVVKPSLPRDDRLILFSDKERTLDREMAAADCSGYEDLDTLANRLIELGISACPFVPMAGLPRIRRKPARALTVDNARLGVSA